MKRTWMTGSIMIVGLGAGLFAFAHALNAQGTPPPPAPTGRVACIDIVRVFNDYEKQQAFITELRTAQTNLQAEDKTRRGDLDKLKADLDKLQPTDPTYKGRAKDLQAKSIDYKNWLDVKQAAINREIGVWSAQFYRDIAEATKTVAAAQGYDVVLYMDEFQLPENLDPQAIRDQIRSRKVIYANPAIDISVPVLDTLNATYRAKQSGPMLDI